jgi:hypothetical protein
VIKELKYLKKRTTGSHSTFVSYLKFSRAKYEEVARKLEMLERENREKTLLQEAIFSSNREFDVNKKLAKGEALLHSFD